MLPDRRTVLALAVFTAVAVVVLVFGAGSVVGWW